MESRSVVNLKSHNHLTSIFSYSYLFIISIFFLNRGLPDYRVFQRAVDDLKAQNNPYSWNGSELPFMHPPTGLFLFRLFDSIDFLVDGLVITLISIASLIFLVQVIHRLTGTSKVFILTLFIFSTSLRVTIGNGQVGVIATLVFVAALTKLLGEKLTSLDYLICAFSIIILLSFKPYFALGLFVASIFRRKIIFFILSSISWLLLNLILSRDLFVSWIRILFDRSQLVDQETNISTLTSILGRGLDIPILGFALQVLFCFALLIMMYLSKNNFGTQFCIISVITLVSSPYLHHQDYLLLIPVLAFLVSSTKRTHFGLIGNFIFVGLQPNSVIAHLIALSAFVNSRIEVKFIGWLSLPSLATSVLAALFWRLGRSEHAYLIYDISGQILLCGLCLLLINQVNRQSPRNL